MSKVLSKHDRMELRKAIGNRSIPGPQMQPSFSGRCYLIAHACFACQKSWKRTGETEQGCPECGRPLALMGRSFRAPKKREDDQWEKVRRLWEAGFRFWSYRSYPEAEAYPDDLRDVDAWIKRNTTHPMRIKRLRAQTT
jgi:hypothetical protein